MAKYDLTESQRQHQFALARKEVADRLQNDRHRQGINDAMAGDERGLIASGTMPGALPTLLPRMSPADRNTAQAQINMKQYNLSPTEARDPALMARAVGSRTGTPLPTPVGAQGADSPMSRIPNPVLRGSTPAEMLSASRGGPTGSALVAQNAANEATAKAAGTGAVVQTPYGTASSRVVPRGTPEEAAVLTDSGVSRAPSRASEPWDVALVRKYPAIGVAGSPENAAFVAKYRDYTAQAAKNPNFKFDPGSVAHNMADEMFAPKTDPAAVATEKATQDSKQAFLANRTAGAIAAQPAAPPTDSPATQTGRAIGSAIKSASGKVASMDLLPGGSTAREAVDLGRGLLGMPAPQADSSSTRATATGGLSGGAASALPKYNADGITKPEAAMGGVGAEGESGAAGGLDSMPGNPSMIMRLRGGVLPSPSGGEVGSLNSLGERISPSNRWPNGALGRPDGWGAPGNAARAGAELGGVAGTIPRIPPYNGPDADSQAFAENPEEAQFRKKMREPQQLQYA